MFSTTSFLGVALQQNPLDAFAIADLLWRVRPRLLIELGTSGGGSALFYAQVMSGYDPQAHVLTMDPTPRGMAGVPLRNWNHASIKDFCPNWQVPARESRPPPPRACACSDVSMSSPRCY